MKRATFIFFALSLCVVAIQTAEGQTLYQETFPYPAGVGGNQPLSTVGWVNDIPNNANRLFLRTPPGNGAVFSFQDGAAGDVTTAFYTTTLLDAGVSGMPFPSIDLSTVADLTFLIDIRPGFSPDNIAGSFAVQIDSFEWYVSNEALAVPTAEEQVYSTYSQSFDPTAAAWNNLLVSEDGSGTGATIGGAATNDLTGNVTGAGFVLVHSVDGGTYDFDTFVISDGPPSVPDPGDVDDDGDVDLDDFDLIADHFRSNVAFRGEGDLTNDGFVDFADFSEWKRNFPGASTTLSLPVPEPGASALALIALALCIATVHRLTATGARWRRRMATVRALIVALAASIAAGRATAQQDNFFQPTGEATWNDANNWQDEFLANNIPEAFAGDRAVIDSGGTAFVDVDLETLFHVPGGVLIGLAPDGAGGTVEVRSGGVLGVADEGSGWGGGVTVGDAVAGSFVVLPGGTANIEGALASGANAANTIILGGAAAGNANVNVGSVNFGGSTRVFPNAALSSNGPVAFGGASNYIVEIDGTSNAAIDAAGDATIGGQLTVNYAGAPPNLGDSWSLLEASSVAGNFAGINSALELSLPLGQKLATQVVDVAGNRQRLDLSVSEFMVLNVNRDTGEVRLQHPGQNAIELDGYSILTSQSTLQPGGWNSLAGQGALGGGWTEANPTAEAISELKAISVGSAAAGTDIVLGNIYDSLAGAFGAEDDLSFEYRLPDESIVQGVVNYTGTRLNNLLLQIDPSTGEAQLRNTSNTEVAIDGYVVSSASASLTPNDWLSLEDQAAGGGGWLELLNSTENQIGELKSTSVTTLSPGASFSLGSLFDPNGLGDLVFEYVVDDGDSGALGAVVYEPFGNGDNADFDGNGIVDGADFMAWQRGFGAESGAQPSDGDANSDGAVNAADLTVWELQFGTAPAQTVAHAVPEPSSAVLSACLLLSTAFVARRRIR